MLSQRASKQGVYGALQSCGLATLALATLASFATTTASAQGNYPISPTQKATASRVANDGVPISELAPNAPDSYTVKRGDTLWAISKIFLKSPWRWPELWGMNMSQIRNPHLIYPGQTLYLDKSNGRARLRMGAGDGDRTVRVSPQNRITNLDPSALPTISAKYLEPFLSQPLIVEPDVMEAAPRIIATQEARVFIGPNDLAYIRGNTNDLKQFQVFRPAKPLRHPITNEIVAYESTFLGTADMLRAAKPLPVVEENAVVGFFREKAPTEEAATIVIRTMKQEMGVGDRLLPTPPSELFSYVPRAPDKPVDARIMSVYEGVSLAGQNSVVTITAGSEQGIDRGHVLAVWRAGKNVKDKTSEDKANLRLPDERYGYLLVFRVFKNVSYALVLQTENIVQLGDRATQP
jgi:hypothetical protein